MRRGLVLVALLAALACAKKGDPVRALIDGAAKDAERKDASALAARLADDFRAEDGEDRPAMEQTLRRLFFGYERLAVSLSEVTIERSPEAARIAFRAALSGTPKDAGPLAGMLPRSGDWRFDLRAARVGNDWKITAASWRPLERGP